MTTLMHTKLVHKLTERFQYALLTASNQIAKEKGACAGFAGTKYSDGILPIDTYKKSMKLLYQNISVIGKVLENLSWSSDYGTARCPHRCLRRAVPLCQTQQTESNHLATTCPLKNQRKDLLSKLFLDTPI